MLQRPFFGGGIGVEGDDVGGADVTGPVRAVGGAALAERHRVACLVTDPRLAVPHLVVAAARHDRDRRGKPFHHHTVRVPARHPPVRVPGREGETKHHMYNVFYISQRQSVTTRARVRVRTPTSHNAETKQHGVLFFMLIRIRPHMPLRTKVPALHA